MEKKKINAKRLATIFAGIWYYLYSVFSNLDLESWLPRVPFSHWIASQCTPTLSSYSHCLIIIPHKTRELSSMHSSMLLRADTIIWICKCAVHTVIHKSTHRLYSHCSTKEWVVVIHTTAYISFLIQQHLTESPSKLVHVMLFLMAIQYLHCGIL